MYFHHNTTKKYTTSLLSIFNDIEVPRYKEDGSVEKVINVPIIFSSRERAINLIEDDYSRTGTDLNVLPKMALSLNSINAAPDRNTNKYARKIYYDDSGKPQQFQINSVSYDFSYTIHIMARTMSDLTMIVEQILPLFRPSYNMRIQELDYDENLTSVPIDFEGISFELPTDLGEDDDIRIITADIDVKLRGNMYLPIKDVNVIEHIITNVISDGAVVSSVENKAYDDDTVAVNDNNTDNTN